MMISTATAAAHPNIAFIKYWGNRDPLLRIPANGSISMNLAPLETRTTVSFDTSLSGDELILNGQPADQAARERVSAALDWVRDLAALKTFARVESSNNFPTGTGIASSASAFAALALAAATSLGLDLSSQELSCLARIGSGSASRSIPGGFVEWQPGHDHRSSSASSIAGPEHWDLVDFVVLVSRQHKAVTSSQGHQLAATSPLQEARVVDAPRRLEICRRAVQEKDFPSLAEIIEQDVLLMHAVMMTSQPPLYYWEPVTLEIMLAVRAWREAGLPVSFTIDAGPNVHVICPQAAADQVIKKLSSLTDVRTVLTCHPGGPAWLPEPEIPGV